MECCEPYLTSLSKLELVKYDAASGTYGLGLMSLRLGLASLHQLSPIREAIEEIRELVSQTGQTVAVATWGNPGPTVVYMEESTYPVHTNLRPGTVMSLLNTATGCVFAAFLPQHIVDTAMRTEHARRLAGDIAESGDAIARFAKTIDEIRKRGLARAVGVPITGVNAFSAPVFDHRGMLELVITIMGPANVLPPPWDGPVPKSLLECVARISKRLGHVQS